MEGITKIRMSYTTFLVQSALSQGADIAIQSTHKVLGSMGQSSMLHAQGALVDRTRISRALQDVLVTADHEGLGRVACADVRVPQLLAVGCIIGD